MRGEPLRRQLQRLATDFDRVARPRRGRYVARPAIADESGVIDVPPPVPDPVTRAVAGLAGVAALGLTIAAVRRMGRDDRAND
jgi:hypothetical protein